MRELKKCNNGHYYDNKYESCPYCAKEQNNLTEDLTEAISTPIQRRFPNPIGDDSATEALTESSGGLKEEIQKSKKEEQDLTVGYYTQKLGVEPVVGWLVCIDGDEKGKSFELHAGRNFIGRGADMDVVLHKDMAVSRAKHAVIIYESRKKMFIAQAGESRELFYVEDEVVLSNTELKPYHQLLIGNTKLLFIPLCGEQFSWE